MKINLEQIKVSPKPIRTTWDEDKMNELAESIKEQGLIVPIKVRPANKSAELLVSVLEKYGDGWADDEPINARQAIVELHSEPQYEIVYGHRRVEAVRRAGLDEMDCIVEGVDDTNTLIQSLIENVVREDMTDIDHANALKKLMEITGWTLYEISKRGITKDKDGRRLLKITKMPLDIQHAVGITITKRHIDNITNIVHGLDAENVLRKAINENLSLPQTEKVAKSIVATKDPNRRKALLNTPYSSFIHDPDINRERAEKYGAYDPMTIPNKTSPGEEWLKTPEVKVLLDYLQSSLTLAAEAIHMDEMGKFSPEARPFIAHKIAKMIEAWQKVIQRLETK